MLLSPLPLPLTTLAMLCVFVQVLGLKVAGGHCADSWILLHPYEQQFRIL